MAKKEDEIVKPEVKTEVKPEVITEKIKPQIEQLVKAPIVPAFESKPENYHFVRIDPSGNEIAGTDFQIGAFNAKAYLDRNSEFKVKKSPTKK